MIKNRPILLAACLACLLPSHLPGQKEEQQQAVINHLERAVHFLKELDKPEHAQQLSELGRRIRKSFRKSGAENKERRAARRHLEIFGFAKSAFAEAGKRDAMELIERSMHAREVILKGRRDKEARQIIERRPKWGAEVELLQYASKILKEFRAKEKAGATAELAQHIANRHREGKKDNPKKKEKPRLTERQVGMQQLEILMYASRVLAEAERGDAAESLGIMAKVMKYRLSGKRNEKGKKLLQRTPSRRATSTHLNMAAELLADQGKKRHAEMVAKTAKQFAPRKRRERDGERKRDEEREHRQREEEHARERHEEHSRNHDEDGGNHTTRLAERLERLEQLVEEIRRELDTLKGRRRR